MAKTSYITIDGMIIGEMANGVMRNYGTDALGSVVETVLNGAQENAYAYKPYGSLLAKTGAAPDPSFLWSGGSGYRGPGQSSAPVYVRGRHYWDTVGTWTTVDCYWPIMQAYAYSGGNPTTYSDRTGRLYANTINGATVNSTCGAACVNANWHLDTGEGPTGFIIQHITVLMDVTDCAGNPVPPKGSCGDYYEAWIVWGGNVYLVDDDGCPMENVPDTDTFRTVDQGFCTWGSQTITGVAKFVPKPKMNLGDIPTGFVKPNTQNSVGCAGQLFTSRSGPTDWKDDGGLVRSLITSWSCCTCTPSFAPCDGPYVSTVCTWLGAKCNDKMRRCS
jgi:hypothetical protein